MCLKSHPSLHVNTDPHRSKHCSPTRRIRLEQAADIDEMTETWSVGVKSSCKLPPQLLALVLARLEPSERLGSMARVCSAWRAAAVMATNSISTPGRRYGGLRQDAVDSLSGWLHAHAAAAALESLTAKGLCHHIHICSLQLPVQQLSSLRSLELDSLKVTVQGQADAQAAAVDLPPELSAITRLRLWDCPIELSTLPAFTNLQHLVLGSSYAAPSGSSSCSPEVSGLVHLTHLYLANGCAQDTVLGSVGALTCLQELLVEGASYTDAAFTALPVSLTKLYVRGDCSHHTWWGQEGPYAGSKQPSSVVLALASTPAVAALTALRRLTVRRVAGFSALLLRDMSCLQHLAVCGTPLLAEAVGEEAGSDDDSDQEEEGRELGLKVLSGLTQLQHLELPQTRKQLAADPTTADVAALTASSHLTSLIIDQGLVRHHQYCHMFPEGRQLAKLRGLRATMGLVGTKANVLKLVRCCPNLERLDAAEAISDEPVFEIFESYDDGNYCSVVYLSDLESLTRLTLNVNYQGCDEVFWRSMTELESLRHLSINGLNKADLGGIVRLDSCKQLTCLETDNDEEWPGFSMTTPKGQAPDIWRRLPSEALNATIVHYCNAAPNGWDVQGALHSMTRAAAEHSQVLERELRMEVMMLRGTVAHLERQQQQRDKKQQQVVAELQGTVAAVVAQVQALVQQNSMQHG